MKRVAFGAAGSVEGDGDDVPDAAGVAVHEEDAVGEEGGRTFSAPPRLHYMRNSMRTMRFCA